MDVDEPGSDTKPAVIPSLAESALRFLESTPQAITDPNSPRSLHVHFHNHISVNSDKSSDGETRRPNLQIKDGGGKPDTSGSSGNPQGLEGKSVDDIIASRCVDRLKNEEAPVLSFPFFDPTKFKPFDFRLSLPDGHTNFPSTNLDISNLTIGYDPWIGQHQLIPVAHHRRKCRLARRARLALYSARGAQLLGESRLSKAVKQGDEDKVSKLLAEGIKPNFQDDKKRTPLHVAVSQNNLKIVSLLMSNGADSNLQDILGNTPLHLAVCSGNTKIVKVLIENGADIHKMDHTSRTPLSIVKARIVSVRENKRLTTEAVKGEFLAVIDILVSEERRKHREAQPMEDLCRLMRGVSTREQADSLADTMISQMSSLCIQNNRQTDRQADRQTIQHTDLQDNKPPP